MGSHPPHPVHPPHPPHPGKDNGPAGVPIDNGLLAILIVTTAVVKFRKKLLNY